MTAESALDLGHAVALLAAAVVAVPLFRKLGLGAVLGYLCAGLLIGPFGLGLFHDPQAILHVAELGVVLFLFLIGLEMRPSKLWALRGEIFGLGVAQVLACGALLSGVGIAFGWPPAVAVIGAMGFVLSSTAVIMKMLDERGETATPAGQRAVSILLLEDLSIIPLLALVAFLGDRAGHGRRGRAAGVAVGAASRSPRVARAGRGRPLGAEPDVPDRRGARRPRGDDRGGAARRARRRAVHAVGRPVDGDGRVPRRRAAVGVDVPPPARGGHRAVPRHPARAVLPLGRHVARPAASSPPSGGWSRPASPRSWWSRRSRIYGVARAFRADHRESLQRAALFAQGGEFAFVLYAAALAAGVFDARAAAVMSAIVILSMALTPILVLLLDRLLPKPAASFDGIDEPPCLQRPRADHRLRPVRAGREPAAAGARRGRVDHRLPTST